MKKLLIICFLFLVIAYFSMLYIRDYGHIPSNFTGMFAIYEDLENPKIPTAFITMQDDNSFKFIRVVPSSRQMLGFKDYESGTFYSYEPLQKTTDHYTLRIRFTTISGNESDVGFGTRQHARLGNKELYSLWSLDGGEKRPFDLKGIVF